MKQSFQTVQKKKRIQWGIKLKSATYDCTVQILKVKREEFEEMWDLGLLQGM